MTAIGKYYNRFNLWSTLIHSCYKRIMTNRFW